LGGPNIRLPVVLFRSTLVFDWDVMLASLHRKLGTTNRSIDSCALEF